MLVDVLSPLVAVLSPLVFELSAELSMVSDRLGVEPVPENLPLGLRLTVGFEPRGDQFLPVFTPEARSSR